MVLKTPLVMLSIGAVIEPVANNLLAALAVLSSRPERNFRPVPAGIITPGMSSADFHPRRLAAIGGEHGRVAGPLTVPTGQCKARAASSWVFPWR